MSIKLVDSLSPMGSFPVAEAKDIVFDDSKSLQEKYDLGELGGEGGGHVELTQAEYDALSEEEKLNGVTYFITDAIGGGDGASIDDNTISTETTWSSAKIVSEMSDNYAIFEGIIGDSYYSTVIGEEDIANVPVTDLYGGWTLDKVTTNITEGSILSAYNNAKNKKIISFTEDVKIVEVYSDSFSVMDDTMNKGGEPYKVAFLWSDNTITEPCFLSVGLDIDSNTGKYYVMRSGGSFEKVKYAYENNQICILNVRFNADAGTTNHYITPLYRTESEVKFLFTGFSDHPDMAITLKDPKIWSVEEIEQDVKTYTSLDQLGLTADATIQDVMDALPIGGNAIIRTDSFTNWSTLFKDIQYGYLKIEKTVNGMCLIELTEVLGDCRIYYGKQGSGKFVEWQQLNSNEILHTSLSGNLAGITTVLDLVNALLTEYRALNPKKPVRFISGEITKTTLTDLPVTYGVLQITVTGWDVVEVRLAHSANGFKSMYYGFLTRISGEESISSITWEKVATTDEVEELKKSVSDGKTLVAGAITNKGVQTATDADFAIMAENVGKIPNAPCGTVWEETDYVMGTGYSSINIAYGNKVFVASHSSRLHYSEDGVHWHLGLDRSAENSNTNDFIAVSYYKDKKIWVAYDVKNNYDSPRHIYYSYNGKIWTRATSSALYFNYFKYHNGRFVVYHTEPGYTSGNIYYSTDGKTWSSTTYFPNSEKCRFYIECANGFWYVTAVDKNSSKNLYRTTNFTGFSFVSSYTELSNGTFYYIEGIYFARLFKNDGTAQYSYSTDGINWYAITMEFTGKTMYGTNFMDCVFFNGRYIASTYAGIISGTIGSTWTQPENMLSTSYTLCQIKDRLFAYTRSGPSITNPGIFYTDDGINWTKAEGSPTHNLETNIPIYECNGKLYINSGYSASSQGLNYPVYMSNDNGASWSIISNGFNILGYYDGIYLARSYKYSFDLETWNDTNITDPSVKTISYVAYGNGILVGCGQGGIKCTYFSPFVKREE